MIAKLTDDQIAAMDSLPPGEPLELIDEGNQRSYILFDKEAYEAWVDSKLQEAFDAIDRGQVEPWDLEKMKRECLERRLRKASA